MKNYTQTVLNNKLKCKSNVIRLCNYKIVNKTTKGAFTYYIITEGEGVSKMLMHDYGEGGVNLICIFST